MYEGGVNTRRIFVFLPFRLTIGIEHNIKLVLIFRIECNKNRDDDVWEGQTLLSFP